MSPSPRDDRLRTLFEAALIMPAKSRGAWLREQCPDDPALVTEVLELLDHAASDDFLVQASRNVFTGAVTVGSPQIAQQSGAIVRDADAWERAADPDGLGRGGRIGPFHLIERIGEGGFGNVYLAERREPMVQRVAIKIIKPGMDSGAVVGRFGQERQALAVMDHPNVARVLDGGVTPSGRPYFVMEYVPGEPITKYCDRHRRTIRQRLEIFISVCDAVQHAHHKGIIHRDLKPSNILVMKRDGMDVVKVIDFGIAKAINQMLTERTVFTEHGQLIGTPEYMSPEQAEMGRVDIDTRTDVYSLGVVMYELIAGVLPFEPKMLRAAGFDEIRRIIREVDPLRPSTRLSTVDDECGADISRQRQQQRGELTRELRRELDWIPLRALRKDRVERYASPADLARDVHNYLEGRPLDAGPESRAYLARKFVRRNKVQVAAGVAVFFALAGGLAVSLWQRNEAIAAQHAEAEQRKLADAAGADALAQKAEAQRQAANAKVQEAEAKKQQGIAEAVAKFQTDMLAAVDPKNVPTDPVTKELLRDKVTVMQAIQAAVKRLDEGSLMDQPLVEANVRDTIGNTLCGLARFDAAEPNLRKSLEIRRAELSAGHPDIATSLNNLGLLLQDQNKLAEAEPLVREALEIRRKALPAGRTLVATSLNNLAGLMYSQNKLVEAEPLYREALEIRREALPPGHPDIALGLNNLAFLLQDQNKLAEAEPLYREAVEIFRAALPAGHPDTALGLNNLASLLQAQNRLDEAEALYREAIKIFRAALPAGHPDIARGLNNLALLLQEQNKFADAEPLFREALEIRRASLPNGHPNTLATIVSQGDLLCARGKHQEAIDLLALSEPDARAAFSGGNARRLASFLTTLGRARIGLGYDAERFALAEANLLEAHPIYVAANDRGPNHKDTRDCVQGLVDLYTAWHAAEPGKGYDAKAAEWKAKLEVPKSGAADKT